MKAYELIMETVLRKTFIRVLHIAWLGTYAAIFLIAFPPELWNWGAFLFGWSGCLLPLLLSAGIFGNDIASGRITLLVTKPVRLRDLYLYRLLGLSLQGAVSSHGPRQRGAFPGLAPGILARLQHVGGLVHHAIGGFQTGTQHHAVVLRRRGRLRLA